LVRREAQDKLWRGLERLKAVDRATLVSFYIRGRSLKQMSREFETLVGTIERRLHVARNRLRRALEQAAGPAGTLRTAARRPGRKRELACV
jgi:RNA polymerase sigma-70 factor (ECF subfamily)